MNAYGPGRHLLQTVQKLIREKPLAPGLSNETVHQMIFITDDEGKVIRVSAMWTLRHQTLLICMHQTVSSPADDATEAWAKAAIEAGEKAKGVPEGGYPRVKELMMTLQGHMKDPAMAMSIADDDEVMFGPLGEVLIGKAKIAESIPLWYGLGGYKGFNFAGPIHTPAEDTAWALVNHDFSGLPDDAPLSKSA